MLLRWALAAFHLLALGIGLGAIWARARALDAVPGDRTALPRAFSADAWWGLAFLLWLSTGLWRLFGGIEKASDYYYGSTLFWTKMGLLFGILILELAPMLTLIRWRRAPKGEAPPDLDIAPTLARLSYVQLALLLGMLLVATGMARGAGT